MKTITIEELKEVLAQHELWLSTGNTEGKRADLSYANLSGANLSDADLHGANLCRADLHGANLSYADLSGANLSDADLSYANLHGADLHGANLSYADLSGANLSGANLSDADLSGANLHGANLSDANLSGANLRYADLHGAASICGVTGNMNQIKSIQADYWPVTYTATHMQIGCQLHTIAEWWAFRPDEIARMDDHASEWWGIWRPILQTMIEVSPAEPTKEEV